MLIAVRHANIDHNIIPHQKVARGLLTVEKLVTKWRIVGGVSFALGDAVEPAIPAFSVRTRAEPRSNSSCSFSLPPKTRKSIIQSSPKEMVATVGPKQCLVLVHTRSRWLGLAHWETGRCAHTARLLSLPARRATVRSACYGLSFERGSRSATRSVGLVAPDS